MKNKPKKILMVGLDQNHSNSLIAAKKVMEASGKMTIVSSETRRMSSSGRKAPHPQNLTKADQEELAPICRQRFENRKKNPARFNKKKKF